jgi:hypothetical protein
MKIYIPPQLKRLAIAFAIFIFLFLLVRHLLVPKSFGEYGHYRGDALIDAANLPELHYAGQAACLDCHADIDYLKQQDVHSEINCETCHGPGLLHTEMGDTTKITKPSSREFCGRCHSMNAGKRKEAVFQVDLKEHNPGKKCIECHNPHQPWTMKDQNDPGENS